MLAAAAGLQVYLPQVAAGAIHAAVAANLHTKASVTVQGPFWLLAGGRFERLDMVVGRSTYQGFRLRTASLDWRDGSIDLGQLAGGQLRVLSPGRLRLRLVVGQGALAQAVAAGFRQAFPSAATDSMPVVVVTPRDITLRGSVTFLDVPVRYSIAGSLVLQDGGRVLAFKAKDLNNAALHMPPLPVLRMQDLPRIQGLPLHMVGVRLLRGALAISVAGPASASAQ